MNYEEKWTEAVKESALGTSCRKGILKTTVA